jgi:hypothetical protein
MVSNQSLYLDSFFSNMVFQNEYLESIINSIYQIHQCQNL